MSRKKRTPEQIEEAAMDNGVWGEFEYYRKRDPKWLTEDTAMERRGEYVRAECCWDQYRYLCEIPRWRYYPRGKVVEVAPARLRLCRYHANILQTNDPNARIFPVKEYA